MRDTWPIPTSCPLATRRSLIERHSHPKNAKRLAESPTNRLLSKTLAQRTRPWLTPPP
jgi:hypothetical protein